MFFTCRHRLTLADYRALVDRCEVIERDGFGEKVLYTSDGLVIKIFRRKRLLTTALLFPYAYRFARNARALSERGVPTVTILEHACCAPLKRHLVTYRPLPGLTVRKALQSGACDAAELLTAVSRFVADLHQKGIYFRSLHFGNIIVSPANLQLGLIDVADMAVRRRPLGARLRMRNFRHLLRYPDDVALLNDFGWSRFAGFYLEATQLSPGHRQSLLEYFAHSENRRPGG